MTTLRRFRSRPPYEVAAEEPPERLTAALVRNLADGVGGQAAYAVPAARTHVVVESWPAGLSGVAGAVGVEQVVGGGAVYVLAPGRWDDAARVLLRDTAVWLGTAVRLTRLRAERDAADLRARRLRTELSAARSRLAKVRDLERARLVQAVTATTLGDLAEVRALLGAGGLGPARDTLDDLIDDFRVVVRGVFPAMLPDSGARAALAELAATLPRPVSFTGDLGRRAGWQLESGFYHAVAAALNLLAGKESTSPVTVTFGRDDALRARIGAAEAPPVDELRTALAQDSERIAVLGGELACAVVDGAAVVTVRLAERIEPVEALVVDPAALERSALYRQVRELVRQGQDAADGHRAEWDAVAERLTMPPRLAVIGQPADGPVPGVAVLAVDAVADRALAAEFLADAGPRGGVDAVLCGSVPTAEFREALLAGRHRVVLADVGTTVSSVAGSLVAYGPVIAARRAVVAMTDLVRGLPSDHQLRWAVERVAVDAHEFAELDLLDELAQGGRLRGVASAAARLLGADGLDPRSRLGLPQDAPDVVVTAAARDAVARWRAHTEHPATSARDRTACQVLVRTAEGLLNR